MVKIKNYEFLLAKNVFKKFNKSEARQKLKMIFNPKDAKIDWSIVPIYMAVK